MPYNVHKLAANFVSLMLKRLIQLRKGESA